MPKRIQAKRIITADVQGDDSWVDLIYPTKEEMETVTKANRPLQERLKVLKDSGVSGNDPEMQELNEKLSAEGFTLITRYVKAWNWVDGEDNPLPPPNTEGVINKLTILEIKYLTSLFAFKDEEKKV